MPLPLPPITLVPGVAQPISLFNLGSIQAIKLSNGSPFDVTYSGFGVIGASILPAGVEDILYADVHNSGILNLLPVNNSGSSGNGIANLVVYQNGEQLPTPAGHWPVTIPVQIVKANVSSVQTLSNESQAAGTLVIDIGPTGSNQAIAIYNDHFVWSVVQSGTAHQVLKGQTSGNPLQIGQSGDITEVLGQLTVDQLVTDSAGLIVNGSTAPTIDISGATGTSGIKWQGGKTTTRQTSGFNAVTTTGTAITHGLGAIPSGIAGGPSIAQAYSITAIGATTFTVTVATSNCNFTWIATVN